MDPIFEEYICTAESVKKELESFRQEQNDLKQKIACIYQKNKALISELRESTLMRENELSEKGVHNLEHNLKLAIAAKDTAIILWQEAMQQVEKLEDQLIGRKSLVEREHKEVVSSFEQIKEQYQKGVMTLSTELSTYRSDLSNAKQELQKKCIELEETKVELKNIKEELIFCQTQLSILSSDKDEIQEKVNSLSQDLTENNNLLSATKKELEKVNSANSNLLSISTSLKEQNKKLKLDISILEKNAKESLFAAQEAILQRKEMAYREEQFIKEIEILKSCSGIDVQKAEMRFNLKMKEIQEQSYEQIKSLMIEIEELHKENGRQQSLFEKVEREKKALESKLELLCKETLNSFPTTSTMFDDLCNRLVLAEKARDEYELRIKSLLSDLEEIKSNKEQDAKRFLEEKNILKERLGNLSKEFRQFLSERIKLNEELSNAKKKCLELEKQLKFKSARQTQEILDIKNEVNFKQQTFNEMLNFVEEHYKTICGELQTLLESQFRINKKWKEETDELIAQSESKIIELCDTIAQLQYQNAELVSVMQKNSSYRQIINSHLLDES